MLKLYDAHPAPSPRRTRIFLAEKGVEYEKITVDLGEKEQLTPDFLAISPRGTVPALVCEEGTVLTENLAIASYVEDLYPDPPLMGRSAVEKALVLEWNWRAEAEGFGAVAETFRNGHPHFKGRAMTGAMDIDQIPELVDRGKARLAAHFQALNARLEDVPYLAGDAFSFADITAAVVIDFAAWRSIGCAPDPSLMALHAWKEKVSARPSFAA